MPNAWQRAAVPLLSALTLVSKVPAQDVFPDCDDADPPAILRDQVACQILPGVNVGAPIPFSYYVPSSCDRDAAPCPVLYLLHGFGGSYRSLLGTASAPSAWVTALTAGPPVDVESPLVVDPWKYYDRSLWQPMTPLPVILVAPHGRTVPGGFGPEDDLDGFWIDWNPRYAKDGDQQRYDTPPPRFETYLLEELIPYVEARFPTQSGREWRALDGESLGGYGSYKNGLQHPDVWASIGSISGAHNFLFAPGLDPVAADSPVGIISPVDAPYTRLIGAPSVVSFADLPEASKSFAVALLALGDPVADQAYFRGNMPRDLAMNARAWTDGFQTLHIRGMVNDTIPRRSEDVTSFSPTSILFEDIVLPMNLEMELAFVDEGVFQDFRLHPGLHSRPYRDPYLRKQIEEHYARLQHPDGSGEPLGAPGRFDYRSIRNDFAIWGWSFHVEREPVEFLNLREVSCNALTLRGTGSVTVTVPGSCGTSYQGQNPFTVELGRSFPFDEPGGVGAAPVWGATATIP